MFYLYHKDDLKKGKKKPFHTAADGDLFTKYVKANIHHTNYFEFIMKTDTGVNQMLGTYMGYYL